MAIKAYIGFMGSGTTYEGIPGVDFSEIAAITPAVQRLKRLCYRSLRRSGSSIEEAKGKVFLMFHTPGGIATLAKIAAKKRAK